MTDFTIKRVRQVVTLKRSAPTILRITNKESRKITIKPSGLRGPQGERGEQGPPGPIGGLDNLDMPDFTLIFDNALV